MTPLPHRYHSHLQGGPDGYAAASATGLPDLPTAPPEEFGGPGDAWTPEHLLLASVETCFLFTLRAVARRSKLTFNALEVDVNGIVDRQDGITRFTEIVVQARVSVPPGTDRDLVARIMDKAERACLVTASLSTPVRLEPTIVIG